jgi:hypothetical protein
MNSTGSGWHSGHREQVVGRDGRRGLEPEGGDLVQHLTLQGERSHDDVEAAHPIAHDDKTAFVGDVAVAHLADFAGSQSLEIGFEERIFTGLFEDLGIDSHGSPHEESGLPLLIYRRTGPSGKPLFRLRPVRPFPPPAALVRA